MNIGLFGLGGNHSDMIIGRFNLKLFGGVVIIPPPVSGGGGGVATPISIPFNLDNPDDYPPERRIEVLIKVRVGSMWHERVFWMLPKNAKIVVSSTNLIDLARDKVSATVSNVRNKIQDIYFNITKSQK